MPRLTAQLLLAVSILCLAGCAHTTPGAPLALPSPSALPRPSSSHVVVMLMENEEASAVLGNKSAPYINGLAHRYGIATQSFAIAHPSLPNYLALTSGSTDGITSDCTDCTVKAANIVDQLETAGISWKAYLEGVPSGCYRGAGSGGYAKKHNPFIYYDDISGSPSRCAHLAGFSQLASDLRAGRLPTYSWISPNLCDDGHDCGVKGSERFPQANGSRSAPRARPSRLPHRHLGRGQLRPSLLRGRCPRRSHRDDRAGPRCAPRRGRWCTPRPLRCARHDRGSARVAAAGRCGRARRRPPRRTLRAQARDNSQMRIQAIQTGSVRVKLSAGAPSRFRRRRPGSRRRSRSPLTAVLSAPSPATPP